MKEFRFNTEYIAANTLEQALIDAAGIELLDSSEIFVRDPYHPDYYGSQYGRLISTKWGKIKLINPSIGGQADRQYLYYSPDKKTTSVHRVIADIFCPDFWTNTGKLRKGERLEAHHCDKQNMHNVWWNIVLLPSGLHAAIHRIKSMKLLKDGKMVEYQNPLEILLETGLSLEEIIAPEKCKGTKRLKAQGGYTVYSVKGHVLAYKYYPKKKKSKAE